MTANTKANINTNKVNADKLNTMTASGQKITRPSDDPVVAIRAMRLNTSLTELEQYYGKNIPDADAWFTDTETALTQTDDVLSSIREKLNQASSQENVTSNVKDILEELKQLKDQVYAIGNADSAGRTVFTGYRTGEMLTFMEQDTIKYEITEKFTKDDLETFKYVKGTASINDSGKAVIGTTVFDGNGEAVISVKYKDVITKGTFIELDKSKDKNDQIIAYARHLNGKTLLVVANKNVNRPVACKIKVPTLKAGQELKNLLPSYGKESILQAHDNELSVELGPARVHVFEIDTPNIENYTNKIYRQNI